MKTVFLPYYGEFGWFIMHHIKVVHHYSAEEKVVCCKKGHEVFFPSAKLFYTNWKNPFMDRAIKRHGLYDNKDSEDISNKMKVLYPGCEIIKTATVLLKQEYNKVFPLQITKKRDLFVDIVLGPRNRVMRRKRNFPKEEWMKVIEELTKLKLSVGIIGAKEISFDLPNVKYKSWDYDDDAAVEMLQNCKMYIGVNSGTSHLAAFCQAPMMVFDYGGCGIGWLQDMQRWNKSFFQIIEYKSVNDIMTKLLENKYAIFKK